MFEAKLIDGNVLKKIVEAIKDVVNDVNIDVSPSGKFFIIKSNRLPGFNLCGKKCRCKITVHSNYSF